MIVITLKLKLKAKKKTIEKNEKGGRRKQKMGGIMIEHEI